MALSRRKSNRFQNAIWPGFVDAMTGLLLVLMFVLTIFMVIQFVLRQTITGQESELEALNIEVAALASTLGLAQDRNTALSADLDAANAESTRQANRIVSLLADRDAQDAALAQAQTDITAFEAQVAGLLSDRAAALASITALEDEKSQLLSDQDALNLALAQAREEIDSGAEAARLAAARREALESMVADLESVASEQAAELSELEIAQLADAAAAEALRERLANADTELTAMTLNLEQQRREAEETLTLLAAARAAQSELDALRNQAAGENDALQRELAEARAALAQVQGDQDVRTSEAARQAELIAIANDALAAEEALSAESQRQVALMNEQIAEMRTQVASLQSLLNLAEESDREAQVQIETLGSQLNTALARVVSEERQRRALEEAERVRLEAEAARLAEEAERLQAEAQNLEQFKSDFFGELRQILEGQDRVRIEGDRFVFSSEVLFEPGSARLSALGEAEIANIAGILRGIADDIPSGIDWVIRVDGHTDNIPVSGGGRYRDNWELSQARALSVVRFMSEDLDIDPRRLAANGFGEFQPINPEDTPEARAQNRRIELKLTER
ncbi:peptidoglycan -binding protein [Yoonia sp. I 8.24]|uniref:peptidoglycan -binding protein n=1 Tax=Yoonia sp. I 8.24 TaxID=1537229 RepID=UPI001EDE9563|nr:peptidoglycan -binding protein [Yoonia sp. I 8.24]MCG3269079.1 peptidoglycan -binding protein [Yoonia sp. I 8.24]